MPNHKETMIKIIIAVVASILAIIGLFVFLDKGYNKDEIVDKKEFKITFQYMTELENEYSMKFGEEKFLIKTADIKPAIDTSAIGETKHTIDVNGETVLLNIRIDDLRKLRLTGTSEIEVPQNIDKEELETIIMNDLEIEAEDGEEDKVLTSFVYPEIFNLAQKGGTVGQILVTAEYEDNPFNKTDFRYTINIQGDQEEVKKEIDNAIETIVKEEKNVKGEVDSSLKKYMESLEKEREKIRKIATEPIKEPKIKLTKPKKKEIKYEVKDNSLLPEDAVLIYYSNDNPDAEEYYEYSIFRDYEDGSHIRRAQVTFNKNYPYSVRLIGQDKDEEILSFQYLIKEKEIDYDWQTPNTEQELALKNLSIEFANAHGFK